MGRASPCSSGDAPSDDLSGPVQDGDHRPSACRRHAPLPAGLVTQMDDTVIRDQDHRADGAVNYSGITGQTAPLTIPGSHT